MRLFGPPEVHRLEAKGKINGLLKALGHEDPETRRQAAAALGRLGDRRAVKPLSAALADSSESVIVESIRALGEIGDPRATPPLIEVLNKPSRRSWLGRTDDGRRERYRRGVVLRCRAEPDPLRRAR